MFRGWVARHAASSFAGCEVDEETGTIYLGFTVDPEGTLEAFKHDVRLIAPAHVQPFPTLPIYTEHELEQLSEKRWWDQPPQRRIINLVGIHVLANKVEVGTEHVSRLRRLVTKHFGAQAPIEVVFSEPAKPV